MTDEKTDMEQAILAAAEELFLDKGFALTSTTEIARRAGCNQALVHYYFRTKENLFASIFARKLDLFFAAFSTGWNNDLPFEESLRRWINAHFDLLTDNPRLPFLIFTEVMTNPARLDSLKDRLAPTVSTMFADLEKRLAVEIERGTIRPVKAIDLMMNLLTLDLSPFIYAPIVKTVIGMDDTAYAAFLAHRREESVETVLRSLKP